MKDAIIENKIKLEELKGEIYSVEEISQARFNSSSRGEVKGKGTSLNEGKEGEDVNNTILSISGVNTGQGIREMAKERSVDFPGSNASFYNTGKKTGSSLELGQRNHTLLKDKNGSSIASSKLIKKGTSQVHNAEMLPMDEENSSKEQGTIIEKPGYEHKLKKDTKMEHTRIIDGDKVLEKPDKVANQLSLAGLLNLRPKNSKRDKKYTYNDLEIFSPANMYQLDTKMKGRPKDKLELKNRPQSQVGTAAAGGRDHQNTMAARRHLNDLFKLRKQLIKAYSREISGPRLVKLVDRAGKVIEKVTRDEISRRYTEHDDYDASDIGDDETVVYEQDGETGNLVKKKVKRNVIEDAVSGHALADLDRQILEASSRYQAEEGDISLFKPANIFENLFSGDIQEQRIQLKYKSELSDRNNAIFYRSNNNLPQAFKNIKVIREKVQFFILVWLRDNLDLDSRTIEVLMQDSNSREIFFKDNQDIFNLVLDTILKRPQLYSKVKIFLFGDKSNEKSKMPELNASKAKDMHNSVTTKSTTENSIPHTKKDGLTEMNYFESNIESSKFPNIPKLDFNKTSAKFPIITDAGSSSKRSFSIKRRQQKDFYSHLRATANKFSVTTR